MATMNGEYSNWVYRGEGNNNLVLSNKKEHIVYRLLKRSNTRQKNEENYHKKMKQQLENAICFVENVMRPLLGARLVNPGYLVQLPEDFIRKADKILQLKKPEYLEDKHLDPLFHHALCLPDHCFLPKSISRSHQPTFCIEIKPNVGFVHKYKKFHEESKPLLCRHCLSQRYKVNRGTWKKESGYCPLDLFSGSPCQMKRALLSLVEHPQNKLRIFKDGILIHGWKPHSEVNQSPHPKLDHSDYIQNNQRSMASLIEGMTQALLRVSPEASSTDSRLPKDLPDIVPCQKNRQMDDTKDFGVCLPRGCVLYRVLQCQMLGSLDMSDLHVWYQRILSHIEEHPQHRHLESLEGLYSSRLMESTWSSFGDVDAKDDGSLEFAVNKVKDFLVYMTVKSCSIMVALQPVTHSRESSEQDVVQDCHGNQFKFAVSVMDLDPKPLHKIQVYLEKEDLYRSHNI